MDKILSAKLKQKIKDSVSNKDDVKQIIRQLSDIDSSRSFALGVAVGRIYNAFYYQSKRILGREPTKKEFEEFLEFVKDNRSDLDKLW